MLLCLDAGPTEYEQQQCDLVAAVAARKIPFIGIVFGAPVPLLADCAAAARALLLAWQPDPQSTDALCDILFGDISPSGRLPVSIGRTRSDLPVHYNRQMHSWAREHLNRCIRSATAFRMPVGNTEICSAPRASILTVCCALEFELANVSTQSTARRLCSYMCGIWLLMLFALGCNS